LTELHPINDALASIIVFVVLVYLAPTIAIVVPVDFLHVVNDTLEMPEQGVSPTEEAAWIETLVPVRIGPGLPFEVLVDVIQ
jgi:hypothetical protein